MPMRSYFGASTYTGMRFTPVSVCAKTYQRPSSSAKLRKYACPFTSNCTFNLPLNQKNSSKKQATDSTDVLDFRSAMIRANPWPSSSLVLLLVFYVHVLRIDDAFVFLCVAIGRTVRSRSRTRSRRALRRLRRLVHLLRQFVRSLRQRLASLVHAGFVVRLQRFLCIGNRVLDVAAFRAGDLIALLAQHLLHSINHGVELVLGVDGFALCLVLGRMRVSFLGHALDFLFAQTGR